MLENEKGLHNVVRITRHGLETITADDAVNLNIDRSASGHNFLCNLCGQYVTLAESKNKTPFFKHNRWEKSKDCPERITVGSGYQYFKGGKYIPKIKGEFVGDTLQFRIGINIHAMFHELMDFSYLTIVVNDNSYLKYNRECFFSEDISFVLVGKELIHRVHITVFQGNKEKVLDMWSCSEDLMPEDGFVLDGTSMELKRKGVDLQTHKVYYLIKLKESIPRGINIQLKNRLRFKDKSYYLYKFSIDKPTDEIFIWFLQKLGHPIVESASRVIPVWPIYCQHDNEIYTESSQIQTVILGDNIDILMIKHLLHTIPCNLFRLQKKRSLGAYMAKLNINPGTNATTFLLGKMRVYEELYIKQKTLDIQAETIPVCIVDENKNPITNGKQYDLPLNKKIYIHTDLDYIVERFQKGWLVEKLARKKAMRNDIYVDYGDIIQIYIGLDKVFSIEFEKEKAIEKTNVILLKKIDQMQGTRVVFDYAMLAVMKYFRREPLLYQWLRCEQRKGMISKKVRNYLLQCVKKGVYEKI